MGDRTRGVRGERWAEQRRVAVDGELCGDQDRGVEWIVEIVLVSRSIELLVFVLYL